MSNKAPGASARLRPAPRPNLPEASVQVLILKEACDVRLVPLSHDSSKMPPMPYSAAAMDSTVSCAALPPGQKLSFSWKIDNFLAFKEILETRKIFSKYISIGSCDLRIGVYESFDTLCIYLESESQAQPAPQDGSYWVQYRIAAVRLSAAVLHLLGAREPGAATGCSTASPQCAAVLQRAA